MRRRASSINHKLEEIYRSYRTHVSHKTYILVLISALSVLPVMAQNIAKSGSLTQIVTQKNTGASKTETTKVFWEGSRMRVERYSLLGLFIELQDGSTIFLYSPKDKSAIKSTSKNAISVQSRLQAMAKSSAKGKKVGMGTVSGVKCSVYTASSGKGRAKWYQSDDSRFPLILKTSITIGSANELTEVHDLKLNSNISDRLFQLPKGVKVTEAKKPTGGTK